MLLIDRKAHWYEILLLCVVAFCIRAFVFSYYMQHNERYCQSDSLDYHSCACCINHGLGMHNPDGRPIYWRTPGYPALLNFFYEPKNCFDFEKYYPYHARVIWFQIILCSLLPLCAYILTMLLTQSPALAWIVAGISVVHTGFVLASSYLLTDAIAQIFFILFLIFFLPNFSFFKKPQPFMRPLIAFCIAALFLALYTWMRPMGQFIALGSAIMLLFSNAQFKQKTVWAFCFLLLFFVSISPWFYRNYKLTGSAFFCPLFGLYLNVFNAPKILSRVANIPLKEAHSHLSYASAMLASQEQTAYQQQKSTLKVCPEMICLKTALPLIVAHPFYFFYDWSTEVIKTTFDLYAYQLIALHHNCFKWDPLIEYLPQKIQECLYKKELPLGMRLLAIIEFLLYFMLWIGIFVGFCTILLKPFLDEKPFNDQADLWLKLLLCILFVVAQTGGFGYARLRLPIELLIIILGCSFWLRRSIVKR